MISNESLFLVFNAFIGFFSDIVLNIMAKHDIYKPITTLKPYFENSTVFIVAQRVSTITNADQIVVLDEGSVVGIGTHKELLKTCQVYKEIVSSQVTEEELANE